MSFKHGRNRSAGQSRQGARSTVKRMLHLGRSRPVSPVGNQTGEASGGEAPALTVEVVSRKYSAGEITYDSAKLILSGGTKVTGAFPPLQTAIEGLLAFVERMDSTVEVDENLAGLLTRIDQVATVFRSAQFGYLCSTEELQRWAADLAKRINTYRETILLKRQRPVVLRFLSVEDDQQHVVKTQRDLDGVVQDFMMNTTGSIASNMEKLVQQLSYAQLRTAPRAGYEAQEVLGCVGNTRESLLEKVDVWAKDLDGPSILWLTGAPLVGKTCIAHTLCQRLDSQHLLGGSFFCSQNSKEQGDLSRIIPTLAHSLACSATRFATEMQNIHRKQGAVPGGLDDSGIHVQAHARFRYASELASAVQGNSNATHFTLKNQLQTFLSKPASSAFIESSLPACIFVIDAIDALELPETSAYQLTESIVSCARPARLKFLITSRFDEHVHDNLLAPGEQEKKIHLLSVDESVDVVDTRKKLVQLSGDFMPPNDWPPLEEVRVLARETYGQPIFASIAFRYLAQYPQDLPNRLCSVIRMICTRSSFARLHGLFNLVLNDCMACYRRIGCLSPGFRHLRLARVNVRLSVVDWSHLVDCNEPGPSFEPSEANATLEELEASDIAQTDREELVKYINNSSSAICQAWRRRNQDIHLYVARCCLKIMKTNLRFNISGARTSHLSNEQQKLQDSIPGHVAYACAAWIEHAVLAAPDEEFFSLANEIFRRLFLFWLEIVSVVEDVDIASSLLQKLHCFCLSHESYGTPDAAIRGLANYVKQARQFVLSTRDAISVSAPHIYLSALCTNPLELIHNLQRDYVQTVVVRSELYLAMVPSMEMRGHTGAVSSVAFSPDGQRLASASWDDTIRLWDARTGAPIDQPLQGHTGDVNSVAFSPDGQRLASASADTTICLWDARTEAPIGQPLQGHTGSVLSVAFSPDGQRLASASDDETIRLWDACTGAPIGQPLRGHTRWVWSVAFSPDGQRLASASRDETSRLWDARTGAPIGQPLRGHTGAVSSVAFSPDGQRLASASWDDTIRLWDARAGAPIGQPLQGHTGTVWSVAFSPDGQWLASASSDTTIRLWDARTGAPIGLPLQGHTDSVRSVAFSPNGQQLASASVDTTIRLWEARPESPIGQPLQDHTEMAWSAAFPPSGQRLAFASHDRNARTSTVEPRDTSNDLDDDELNSSSPAKPGAETGQSTVWHNSITDPQKNSVMAFSPFPEHHGSLGALLPPDSPLDPRDMFRMDDDGWMRGPHNELILWIRPEYRSGLWWPCSGVKKGEQAVYLDLSRFVHGEDWTKCYTGLVENSCNSDPEAASEMQHSEPS